jgi:hypothetical protein
MGSYSKMDPPYPLAFAVLTRHPFGIENHQYATALRCPIAGWRLGFKKGAIAKFDV